MLASRFNPVDSLKQDCQSFLDRFNDFVAQKQDTIVKEEQDFQRQTNEIQGSLCWRDQQFQLQSKIHSVDSAILELESKIGAEKDRLDREYRRVSELEAELDEWKAKTRALESDKQQMEQEHVNLQNSTRIWLDLQHKEHLKSEKKRMEIPTLAFYQEMFQMKITALAGFWH